jgi:FKBP-type peptidyl-prolyl cis-trans isomerase SlyD
MPRQLIITLNYTIYDDKQNILSTTEGDRPFIYDPKTTKIIPALKKLILNRKIGDTFEAWIPPKNGFGERQDNLQQTLPLIAFSHLPQPLTLGMICEAKTQEGLKHATIVALNDDTVTVDANHALSGQNLIIRGCILAIR